MRVLVALCMTICLGQPAGLFAMTSPPTIGSAAASMVHVIKIVDENWQTICDSRYLEEPSFLCANVGIRNMCIAKTRGISVYATFKYSGEETSPASTVSLGERGTFTFWLDDRAFWCTNEIQQLVNARDEEGHVLRDKHGSIKKIPAPITPRTPLITHLTPLISSLQPNTHYWITIRITKNGVKAYFC